MKEEGMEYKKFRLSMRLERLDKEFISCKFDIKTIVEKDVSFMRRNWMQNVSDKVAYNYVLSCIVDFGELQSAQEFIYDVIRSLNSLDLDDLNYLIKAKT
jgi:hypothetical protein